MSDRTALLTAIRQFPAEDTPRLVYADWLDENGDRGDLDRATVEFIRMSCTMKGSARMPKAVYPWLLSAGPDGRVVENWKRLIPSVVAINKAACPLPDYEPIGVRRGRCVSCSVAVPQPPDGARPWRPYSATFEFCRGFLLTATLHSPWSAAQLVAPLYTDQPLTALEIPGLTADRAQVIYERLKQSAPHLAGRFKAEIVRAPGW